VVSHIGVSMRSHGACWDWTVTADTEITGPMALRLYVEVDGADDVDLFAGVEKWRGRTYVPFEGSYGFGRDRITTGWLKASLRALDQRASRPFDPVPTSSHREPLSPGQVVQADIALGLSATLFRAGETLRLVVAGRWLWPRNLLTGQFPPPTRKARKANAPCTGDQNTLPASWALSFPTGRWHLAYKRKVTHPAVQRDGVQDRPRFVRCHRSLPPAWP
jgi:hypothetical protein